MVLNAFLSEAISLLVRISIPRLQEQVSHAPEGNNRFEASRSIHSILRQLHSDVAPLI